MKFLICVLALVAFVSAKAVEEAKLKECAATNKITDYTALLDKMMKPGFSAASKDEKCFGLCVGMASGCLSAEGAIVPGHESDAPESMDKTKIVAAYTECIKLTDADPCEQGYKQWTCMLDKAKKM